MQMLTDAIGYPVCLFLLSLMEPERSPEREEWRQERHNSWELPLATEAPSVACLHFDRTLKNLTRIKYTFNALSPLTHLG